MLSVILLFVITIRACGIRHIKKMSVVDFIFYTVSGNLGAGAMSPDLSAYLQNGVCLLILAAAVVTVNKVLDRKDRQEAIKEIFGEDDTDA